MEYNQIFELELCYNNSDSQSDYYNPDASFGNWYICSLERKIAMYVRRVLSPTFFCIIRFYRVLSSSSAYCFCSS